MPLGSLRFSSPLPASSTLARPKSTVFAVFADFADVYFREHVFGPQIALPKSAISAETAKNAPAFPSSPTSSGDEARGLGFVVGLFLQAPTADRKRAVWG